MRRDIVGSIHSGRVCVGYRGCEVEDGAYGHRVLECGGVKGDELGAGVRECGCAAERELEGLFEEEAAEDHELVAVTVFCLPLAHTKVQQGLVTYVVA